MTKFKVGDELIHLYLKYRITITGIMIDKYIYVYSNGNGPFNELTDMMDPRWRKLTKLELALA